MRNPSTTRLNSTSGQRGAVLIIALIMLVLMTLLGLGASRTSTLEERMAGNWRDVTLAQMAAEAGLREGERWLAPQQLRAALVNQPGLHDPGTAPDVSGLTVADWEELVSNEDAVRTTAEYAVDDDDLVSEKPIYLIEYRAFVRDHLGTGFGAGYETGRDLFVITGRGSGQTQDASALHQSHFAKRFH